MYRCHLPIATTTCTPTYNLVEWATRPAAYAVRALQCYPPALQLSLAESARGATYYVEQKQIPTRAKSPTIVLVFAEAREREALTQFRSSRPSVSDVAPRA